MPENEDLELLVSGLYVGAADAAPAPGAPPWPFVREELRVDVDGRHSLMAVSGALSAGLATRVEWVASLTALGDGRWRGAISYKHGNADALPFAEVEVRVVAGTAGEARRLTVAYGSADGASQTREHVFASALFRQVAVEIDSVVGAEGVTAIGTGDHPNRPADLVSEALDVEEAFRRAGLEVRVTRDNALVPLDGAGENQTWDNAELHDAMQAYWSQFADAPAWAFWVLFAKRHDAGRGLGGVMFDDIGPQQRQGVAIFTDSNIARPPAAEASPEAWVKRMKFFTLVHEMGHAFNLAHSWEKSSGTGWIGLLDEPEARSFMNYPQRASGGEEAFFRDFHYRFTDAELLFLRHAPEQFVEMGQASWFDDHGFRMASTSDRPGFGLEVRLRPEREVFDFLEPVVLELKLTNLSPTARTVPADVLSATDRMTVILKRRGQPARRWVPFARACAGLERTTLEPAGALYASLFVSAGQNGWDIAEPGIYAVQIALHLDSEDIVSSALHLRVAPPRWRTEEVLAQDYFSDDVGRVLAMDGSLFLDGANKTLQELATRFKAQRAARHALVALTKPALLDFKRLRFDAKQRARRLDVQRAKLEVAQTAMDAALLDDAQTAMETLGHIDFSDYVKDYCQRLEASGKPGAATSRRRKLLQALSRSRSATGRPVLPSVLAAVARRLPERKAPPRKRKSR